MLSAAELGITTIAFTAGKRLVKIDKVRYVGLLGLIGQAGLPLMSKGSPKSRYCGDLRLKLVSSRGLREVQKQDRRTDTKTRGMSRAVTDV